MAKPEKKKTSPIFWVGLLGLSVAAYVLTTPEEVPVGKKVQKPVARKANAKDGFLDEDYKAKFAPIAEPFRNSFVPQVVGMKDRGSNAPNALPGSGSWVFTGTAELNGSRSALIENASTGEGKFLAIGEAWESYTVAGIRENSIILRGPDGSNRTISLEGQMDSAPESTPPLVIGAPGGGPLRGPIGNVDIRPLSANTAPNLNGERNAN